MKRGKLKIKIPKKITKYILIVFSIFVAATFIVGLSTTFMAMNNIYHDIDGIPKYQVGIVFGTTPRMLNGLPNSYYSYRIRGAVDLYKAGKINKILVSGDNRSFKYNEPKAMRKSLEDRGVKPEDIIEDFAGRDTYDSVIRARNIFGLHNHLYITQRFQADRAITMAKWNGIEANAYVVPETKNTFVRMKLYTREYLARVKMLFSLIFNVDPEILGKYEPIY